MPKDLRTYLNQLNTAYPESLKIVDEKVNRRFGITGYATKLAQRGEYPGLLFKNVEGAEDFTCVSNLLTSYERIALFLDCDVQDIPRVFGERIKNRVAPKEVSKEEAPVKEVIIRKEEVNLDLLPIPVHNEMDGGPYLSAGLTLMRECEDLRIRK
jgi:2,5-furandicarboxylate decarboxylase 1